MRRYVKVLAAGSLVGFQSVPSYIGTAAGQIAQLPGVTITGSSSGSIGGCSPNCTPYAGGPSPSGGGSQEVPENEANWTKPAPPPPAPPPPPKPDPVRVARCESDFKLASDRTTSAYKDDIKFCSDMVIAGRAPSGSSDWAAVAYASCRKAADARMKESDDQNKATRSNCLAAAGTNGG